MQHLPGEYLSHVKTGFLLSVWQNLRELSMHLLKHSVKQTPMNVHIIATRYVAAQLEISKHLCMVLSQCASVDPYQEQERGFALV